MASIRSILLLTLDPQGNVLAVRNRLPQAACSVFDNPRDVAQATGMALIDSSFRITERLGKISDAVHGEIIAFAGAVAKIPAQATIVDAQILAGLGASQRIFVEQFLAASRRAA